MWTEIIRPQLVSASIAMMQAVCVRMERKGVGVEWIGVDFLVDSSFGVHLLEANVSPDASHTTPVRPACSLRVCLCFHLIAKEHVHALKSLACRKRVAAASWPAATCKKGVTSPPRHACGCARPSRARFGNRNTKIVSDESKSAV